MKQSHKSKFIAANEQAVSPVQPADISTQQSGALGTTPNLASFDAKGARGRGRPRKDNESANSRHAAQVSEFSPHQHPPHINNNSVPLSENTLKADNTPLNPIQNVN